MANLIDTSYFIGDIEIPNLAQPEEAASLNNSIALYEKECLLDLLGYSMYKDLVAAVPVSGDKWYKLINGAEFSFTFNGETVTRYFEGLKGSDKKSLIAYYVYFMHRKKHASYMSGNKAEVEAESENSKKVANSLYEKLVSIYNEFVFMYGEGSCYDWEMVKAIDAQHYNDAPSAYNYLVANKADFTNWVFTGQEELNSFGVI